MESLSYHREHMTEVIEKCNGVVRCDDIPVCDFYIETEPPVQHVCGFADTRLKGDRLSLALRERITVQRACSDGTKESCSL